MRRLFAVSPILLLALACSEPRKVVSLADAIPNLPLPPEVQILSREGGEEALKLKVRSALDPERVTAYYRGVLSTNPWRLVSDVATADGAVNLYAEDGKQPLWVTIRKAEGAAGTFVDLSGAKVR